MVGLDTLILAIVLSAVAVFVASSIIWTATPLHKNDYKKLAREDAFLDTVRDVAPGPGRFAFPFCKPGDEKDEAVAARVEKGPWGMLLIAPGKPNMGKALGMWMLYLLLVGLFVAYLLTLSLREGARAMDVLQVASTVAFLAHAGGAMPGCIWRGEPWSGLKGQVFDALVYALLTGGIFAWQFPTG